MDGMYSCAEQAIHIAYLVMSVEPRQPNALAQMLRHVLEDMPYRTKKQEAMLEYLGGSPDSDYVDPSERLTMDEFRGQCASITDRVRKVLPGPELFAVWARWGVLTGAGNEKSEGVRGLSKYCEPLIRITSKEAIQALVYGQTNSRWRAHGLSYEDISAIVGAPESTVRSRVHHGLKQLRHDLARGDSP